MEGVYFLNLEGKKAWNPHRNGTDGIGHSWLLWNV